ncbi:MAG: FkbM family methyltransferase [Planctomycetota bacterium]
MYRQRFGIFAGMRIALKVRQASYAGVPGSLVPVCVPGLSRPIHLRCGTTDAAVFEQVFIRDPFRDWLKFPPEVIVDAGAYIGLTSLYLASLFPQAKIFALEIDASNFALLKRNVADCKNIFPLHKALWYERALLTVENPDALAWSYRGAPCIDEGGPSVPAIDIPDLLAQIEADTIDLLKIDIEGAERELFSQHSDRWIGRVRAIAVELHDRFKNGCRAALEQATAGQGFRWMQRGEYTLLVR